MTKKIIINKARTLGMSYLASKTAVKTMYHCPTCGLNAEDNNNLILAGDWIEIEGGRRTIDQLARYCPNCRFEGRPPAFVQMIRLIPNVESK